MSIKYKKITRYQKYLIKMNMNAKFWYMVQLEIRVAEVENVVDAVIISSEHKLSIEELERDVFNFIKLNPKKVFFKEYRLHSFSVVEAYQLNAS
ncbi:hypothetical protein ACDZ28_00735 (plasmid) [Paenibacillus sp. RS8]|uniref:hypothetical protein n=1 Tax=Paenibacillus sp. RS8 TaxID=3242681 RepID=UPI0035C00753